MPRRYPAEFRRKVLDLIEAGRPMAEIAAQLGVTGQTIYNWRSQDQIDRGLRSGMSTSEPAELTAAKKRIRELELANAIFEYLEIFHNRQRRHSSLGMLSPIEYELRYADTTARDQAS